MTKYLYCSECRKSFWAPELALGDYTSTTPHPSEVEGSITFTHCEQHGGGIPGSRNVIPFKNNIFSK